jgi:hypothetical protein
MSGSVGYVGHDLDGYWVRNQKNGSQPEDTVPLTEFGFWRCSTSVMPPTAKEVR